MGKRLKVVEVGLLKLQIDPKWTCQRSGDCCTKIREVVMTKEEAAEIVHHAPPSVSIEFRPVEGNFVAMKAGPCPLFVFRSCMVYEHRPYNCRRFGCMRPDVTAEPFDPDGSNQTIREQLSKEARKLGKYMQRKAMPWADAHGWKP